MDESLYRYACIGFFFLAILMYFCRTIGDLYFNIALTIVNVPCTFATCIIICSIFAFWYSAKCFITEEYYI